jgi:hypothetical protein
MVYLLDLQYIRTKQENQQSKINADIKIYFLILFFRQILRHLSNALSVTTYSTDKAHYGACTNGVQLLLSGYAAKIPR